MILVEAMQRAEERRQGQSARRNREEQRLYRHRRHREHVADRSMGLDLSAFHMLEIKNGDWTLVPGTLRMTREHSSAAAYARSTLRCS